MSSAKQSLDGLEALASHLAAQPDIAYASAFGSVPEGRARSDSDLDLAVWTDAPLDATRQRDLMEVAAELGGRPVDLVDLREAGPLLLLAALRGKRLVCRSSAVRAALLSRGWIDAADFLPVRERLLQQRRTAWTG